MGDASKDQIDEYPLNQLGWISHKVLAEKVLGKSGARAARNWCQARNVPYRRDGQNNWSRIDDVKRAIEELPMHGPKDEVKRKQQNAIDGAASIMYRGKRK